MHTVDSEDLKNELDGFDAAKATNAEKLALAQTALFFAIHLLKDVADATDDEHARAYLIDHLAIMASADHGFISRDFNIDEWIKQIENGDDDDE